MTPARARDRAKARAQAGIDAARDALAAGAISETEWQVRVSRALAESYLAFPDPRWQSGFDGDAQHWRDARELVLDAVPVAGSLLDVGCANGHLLECLAAWGRERGLELTLFGLDLDADLADEARRRLPALATHIFTGNVVNWMPPRRFTYVRTGLEYVPPGRESALLARVLRELVEPGGRIIVGPVYESDLAAAIAAFADAGIGLPGNAHRTDANGKSRHVLWGSPAALHAAA